MNGKIGNVVKAISKASIEGGKTFLETGNPGSAVIAGSHNLVQSIVDTGADYAQRSLSEAETDRVTRALEYIKSGVSARIAQGLEPNAEFFIHNDSGRKPSVEICEGVLQKCKLEYEELKLPYVSNIFVNAPFMSQYSNEEVFYRLMLSEKLTYRQLCILSLVGSSRDKSTLKKTDYVSGRKSYDLRSLLSETFDLYNMGLVQNYIHSEGRAYSLSGLLTITPHNLTLTKDGERQFEIMGLEKFSEDDLVKLESMLS